VTVLGGEKVSETHEAVDKVSLQQGLRLRTSTVRDGVLVLSAASLEELPTPEKLSSLGHSLCGDGVRFVALRLDEDAK
jgi:hypothetical protein